MPSYYKKITLQELAIQIEGYDGIYSITVSKQDFAFIFGEITRLVAPIVCYLINAWWGVLAYVERLGSSLGGKGYTLNHGERSDRDEEWIICQNLKKDLKITLFCQKKSIKIYMEALNENLHISYSPKPLYSNSEYTLETYGKLAPQKCILSLNIIFHFWKEKISQKCPYKA